ncbi:MAG: amidohydrolase [Bacteroidia bacterium]|nr:amidohydrolase [Bacteroidia bacterium]
MLKLGIIQSELHWEQKTRNLEMFTDKIREMHAADVYVLPEMFSTGFSMNSSALAEGMNGPTVQWMRTMSAEKNAVITGSTIICEEDTFYNRLIWMQPDGTCTTYDKRHLFRMGNEQNHYSPGASKVILEYKGWRIMPLVCYDLRFPVWCRQPSGEKPCDLQLFVANWPERRSFPWQALLTARAIENQCFVAGVNRVGADGNGIEHSGNSAVLDFKGQKLSSLMPGKEGSEIITLSLETLNEFRAGFPAGMDADRYTLD